MERVLYGSEKKVKMFKHVKGEITETINVSLINMKQWEKYLLYQNNNDSTALIPENNKPEVMLFIYSWKGYSQSTSDTDKQKST